MMTKSDSVKRTADPAANPAQGTTAMLKNVAAFMALTRRLQSRDFTLPGIGVFHGYSGYGKSMAAIYAQNKTGAIYVEVGESWTKKTLIQKILFEAGGQPRGTIADMTEKVIATLGQDPDRPLIIDEADKLVDKGNIEIVREIHDAAQVPVILIGEEQLPAKLISVERVHNRVLDWTAAQPCDLEDARALAELFVGDVEIGDDLLAEICRQSDGRARRIVVNLYKVREHGRNTGAMMLDQTSYKGGFFTGQPPVRKRRAA